MIAEPLNIRHRVRCNIGAFAGPVACALLVYALVAEPTDNAHVESFNGSLRAECLDVHWFATQTEAKQVIESWRREHNDSPPHRSLGERTPSEFACQLALNGDLPSSQTVGNSP